MRSVIATLVDRSSMSITVSLCLEQLFSGRYLDRLMALRSTVVRSGFRRYDIEQYHALADALFQVDVFLQPMLGQKFTSWMR